MEVKTNRTSFLHGYNTQHKKCEDMKFDNRNPTKIRKNWGEHWCSGRIAVPAPHTAHIQKSWMRKLPWIVIMTNVMNRIRTHNISGDRCCLHR